jgi:hypothetical protein
MKHNTNGEVYRITLDDEDWGDNLTGTHSVSNLNNKIDMRLCSFEEGDYTVYVDAYYKASKGPAKRGEKPVKKTSNMLGDGCGSFTLTITITPNGSGTVSRSPEKNEYQKGDKVTLTAVPSSGYAFEKWEDGVLEEIENPYTTTLNAKKTLKANFVKSQAFAALTLNSNDLSQTFQRGQSFNLGSITISLTGTGNGVLELEASAGAEIFHKFKRSDGDDPISSSKPGYQEKDQGNFKTEMFTTVGDGSAKETEILNEHYYVVKGGGKVYLLYLYNLQTGNPPKMQVKAWVAQ